MKLRIIAISATAVMCAIGGAAAQSSDAGAGASGTLCSAFTAMDTATQAAFIQGYRAGRMDAMMSGSGSAASSGSADTTATTTAAGADSTTTTTTTDGATDAASTTTTTGGTDAMATTTTTSDASAGSAAGANGAMAGADYSGDLAAVISGCADTPAGSVWQFMEAHGGSDPVASQQK